MTGSFQAPMGSLRSFGGRMACSRKSLKAILQESEEDHAAGGAKLGLVDLLCIGVGATIGSGVFVLTGKAVTDAGPSSILAWLIAGFVCLLSGCSYIELSTRLPAKGSCYMFSYHALGEIAGVMGAVSLTMEYGVSGSGVARSWAVKLYENSGSWWVLCYNGARAPAPGCNGDEDNYADPMAAIIVLMCAALIARGLDCGKLVINFFTTAKIVLVLFMIGAGLSLWNGNMFQSPATFFPRGSKGVLATTSQLFFGFIGFDEVCCMASKAKKPSWTMPRALIGTLFVSTVLSGLAQLALCAAVPYKRGVSASFSQAFEAGGFGWAAWLVRSGEFALLPVVVLLTILAHPELFAAMSVDGLLPSLFRRQNRETGAYVQGSAVIGVALALIAGLVPFAVLWDIISIGVLLGFNLTNAALISLRYGNGGERTQPGLDGLVWFLLTSTGVASFGLGLGVLMPLSAGEGMRWWAAAVGAAGLLGAMVATVIVARMPVRCDMDDASVFKAHGVPFVPVFAMVSNWFLVSTFPWAHSLYFLCCVVLLVGLSVGYVYVSEYAPEQSSWKSGECYESGEETTDESSQPESSATEESNDVSGFAMSA